MDVNSSQQQQNLDAHVLNENLPLNQIGKDAVPTSNQNGVPQQPSLGQLRGTGSQGVLAALFQSGKLDQESINQAKVIAVNQNKSIESVLLEQNKVTEEDLYQSKAQVEGYKFVELTNIEIPIDVLNKVSKDVAQKHMAIPFQEEDGKVRVALADPGDLQKVKFLQIVIGKPLELFVASPSQIQQVIDKQYGGRISAEVDEALEEYGDILEVGNTKSNKLDSEDVSVENLDSAPVSRIANMILEYAVKYKASDVHIEPRENKVVVRFRISGVLVEKLTLPKKLAAPVASRIKILSSLKIDEHRLPQDGRFQIKFGKVIFDLRVSIMPSVYGEKIVMRLLETGGGHLSLEGTGLRGFALKSFQEALHKTEGIILVTGPTGSGKTHTLASSLKILNQPSVNILTLEDPVEIRIDGVTQVQVKPDIGLTFASGLRAFLRQDPDVIMVGEIRDKETAALAVQAALTGHLVLATLHTNSAAGAIPRLLDMEVESFLLSSTINVILAQRLARKVCPDCIAPYNASPDELKRLHEVLDGLKGFDITNYPVRKDEQGNPVQNNTPGTKEVTLYKGQGCSKCNGSGYVGRIGIFEVLPVSEKIGQLIMEHRSAFDIEAQGRQDGMIMMIQDGFLKALEGLTTIAEVLRVVN
ncbi:Flp pilus assembly complex ATPase component TadA [Candidatus Dojkabacteria bacterium]|uniref:Flp pilus assembly complex ATPase component TadA n=1 Tax=Candidatus Dojkabacteria bacterium TaxID=2099670 RepID=A0A955L9T4_9BACT|nr:Flp pilus assembly complex ATPase component TadA [Candidatus Dojkabacteria bacterium]